MLAFSYYSFRFVIISISPGFVSFRFACRIISRTLTKEPKQNAVNSLRTSRNIYNDIIGDYFSLKKIKKQKQTKKSNEYVY